MTRMTDNNHPITPPPELLQQWATEYWGNPGEPIGQGERYIAIEAARWGSDMELEACCEWLTTKAMAKPWETVPRPVLVTALVLELRAARRPKPPSLKEQAKFAAAVLRSPDETCSIAELQQHWHTICNALEQLDD